MIKTITKNFIITDYKNGNCHIRVNEDSIEYLKTLDYQKLTNEVNQLINNNHLYLTVINGYHYLMNHDESIAYDIYFFDNFIMEIEKLIKGKEKVVVLEKLPKKEIKRINEDLSNGF